MYFRQDDDGFAYGANTDDMLGGQIPGVTGPLEQGAKNLERGGAALETARRAMGIFRHPIDRVAEAAVNKGTEAGGDFLGLQIQRTAYLLLGLIFITIGLVMIAMQQSKSVRAGVADGVSEAIGV